MMKTLLKENGLPEDLVYMALIESGFNPCAYSRMKAAGPWQFIYRTGKRYGLNVTWWVDERRDLKNPQWRLPITSRTSMTCSNVGTSPLQATMPGNTRLPRP